MMRASSVAMATVLAMSAVPASAKDVIEDASRFTVKTMTAIEYAFGSESKGAFRGSGFLVDRERGWILTNAHVAGRSPSTVRINFKDQPRVTAKKLYIDIVKRERGRNSSRYDFLVRRVEIEEIRIVTERGMHVPRQ